jgi:hypothetical protein
MKNIISLKASFRKSVLIGFLACSSSVFAQNTIVEDQSKVAQESLPIPVELKQNPEEFFIINDKPVTKQEYLEYLAKKEDEEKSSSPE